MVKLTVIAKELKFGMLDKVMAVMHITNLNTEKYSIFHLGMLEMLLCLYIVKQLSLGKTNVSKSLKQIIIAPYIKYSVTRLAIDYVYI